MEDLSLHILDVAENAVRANATVIDITVHEDEGAHTLTVVIKDDGVGMTPEESEKACDPFFTTKGRKRVGLGLPLLRQSAEETGGHMGVRSAPGKGTEVTAVFHTDHADMRPVGDLLETIVALMMANPAAQILLDVRTGEYRFRFDSLTGSTETV